MHLKGFINGICCTSVVFELEILSTIQFTISTKILILNIGSVHMVQCKKLLGRFSWVQRNELLGGFGPFIL